MRKKNYKGRCEKRVLEKCDGVCKTYDPIQRTFADILQSDNNIMYDLLLISACFMNDSNAVNMLDVPLTIIFLIRSNLISAKALTIYFSLRNSVVSIVLLSNSNILESLNVF